MKISEIKGEDALDALAEMMEPAIEIMGDNKIAMCLKSGQNLKAIKFMLQNHKQAVLKIFAILDGEDFATYSPSLLSLPKKLLEIVNDEEIIELFTSQSQNTEEERFGSATVNIEESEA